MSPMNVNPNWFLSAQKKPAPQQPSLGQGVYIEKIAPSSPAASLGLQAGDTLLNINGQAALSADIADVLFVSETADYTFYLPQTSEFMQVKTKALPLGIRTAPSSDGIVQKYVRQGFCGTEGWFSLWERGEHEKLRIAAQACLKQSLVGKLFGKKPDFLPAELMVGIADIEAGNLDAGFAALDKFAQNMYDWTTDFHGLVYYYRGLNALRENDTTRATELVNQALNTSLESARLIATAKQLDIQVIDNDSLIGRVLPLDYELTYLRGGKGATSIPDLLENMKGEQILPLCLMPYYRGNGPYNACLQAYVNIYGHVQDVVHPMVVMTDNAERKKDRAYYFKNEDAAFKRKIPLLVLHEATASFSKALSLRGAPSFHALNKSGRVVWSGSLDDGYAYWDMIAQAQEYD